MNQILMMENRNNKNNRNGGNNSSVDIKKILIFFAIAIMVFGLILVIKGISDNNKNKKNNNNNVAANTPAVNTPYVEPTENPSGEPSDEPSDEPTVPQTDEEEPTLDLSILGNKIKVIATDDVALAYIEYTWNNGVEKIIEASEENKKRLETYIDIIAGKNTLRVNAVDQTGKKFDRTIDIKGRVLPEIEFFITADGTGVIIRTNCSDGLDHVVWRIDDGKGAQISFTGDYAGITREQWADVGAYVEMSEDGKVTSLEYTYPLPEGAKTLSVYAYSLEGEVQSRQGNISL